MQTKPFTPQISCADDVDTESIRVAEARQRILASLTPISDYEKLPIRGALGRVLHEAVISPINVPAHINSAMDGIALNSKDLPTSGTQTLDVIGTAYAGVPYRGECHAGQCVRIMTGAPMPQGTDTVIMQEHVESIAESRVRVGLQHRPGQNVRQIGEDIRKDSEVVKAGRYLTPADLGVLASLGIGEVKVRRRPRVAFFSTGDELRSIGETLGEGEIFDSNRYSLYGMLAQLGVEILDMGVVRDNPEALRESFLRAAAVADVIVTSGGVSVGDADYIKSILTELGEINFWKIAMKPGRPLTYGQLGKARFFGLPGNPVAVMVTFYQFVQPALHYLSSGSVRLPLTLQATCTSGLNNRPGRFEFQRGMLTQTRDGHFEVTKAGKQGSGILTSMSHANCFILLAEDCERVEAGDTVTVQPFAIYI
ncbi:MAG: molybdopterin molybdenumtransferase MoeA [Gammaproteobacteria bacterium]|nr:molybdopterin molybdenumtransferase MoeA [Gammaproteobacteria bacterium]